MGQPQSAHDARELARCRADTRRSTRPLLAWHRRPAHPRRDREHVLEHLPRGEQHSKDDEAYARRAARTRQDACRQVFLQLLALPVAARRMGYRPALPYRAHSASRRAPYAQRHAAGHNLRLGRQDCQLRDQPTGIARAARTLDKEERGVLSGRVPRGRIPGDIGRHAQPLRRHQRRTHLGEGRHLPHRPNLRR